MELRCKHVEMSKLMVFVMQLVQKHVEYHLNSLEHTHSFEVERVGLEIVLDLCSWQQPKDQSI